jgi:GntR family transcriptional repressor for pyruvate dehydrogenase complex
VNHSQKHSKVYIEIVNQLRNMIREDNLKPGDKIPSERELTERLNVGRSSVREALRSLELLGLIETRRGEGTFIRDFSDHRLVDLLSTFILEDEESQKDVCETKYLIELDCLRLIVQRNNDEKLNLFYSWLENNDFTYDEFFFHIVTMAENRLLLRIWIILKEYEATMQKQKPKIPRSCYFALVEALMKKDQAAILSAFHSLRKLSKGYRRKLTDF